MNRWKKLNQRLSVQGLSEVPRWAANWMYWNSGVRPLADRVGLKPKRYGITQPILVFQMGKVGSTSVYASLKRLELDVPLYHLHFLNNLDDMEETVRRFPARAARSLELIATARKIRQEMARQPRKKWNIITLVREPIPRLVSVFFESIDDYIPNMKECYAAGELGLDAMISYFVNEFRESWVLNWFDTQVRDLFGLDVFETPFDKGRGYQIYEQSNIRLLLMRLHDLNRVAPQAMHEFLGISNFQLVTRNVGEAKATGSLYRDFVNGLRLPPTMVHEWHSTRYAKHFYTPEELAASVARWT